MLVRFFLFLLILFFAARFIMRVVLPIMRVTSMTHKKVSDLQRQMNNMQSQEQNNNASKKIDGDYIDYEEVK
ncbi:MAG: hypothetical protein QM642_06450 [Edaphocola sp.]